MVHIILIQLCSLKLFYLIQDSIKITHCICHISLVSFACLLVLWVLVFIFYLLHLFVWLFMSNNYEQCTLWRILLSTYSFEDLNLFRKNMNRKSHGKIFQCRLFDILIFSTLSVTHLTEFCWRSNGWERLVKKIVLSSK